MDDLPGVWRATCQVFERAGVPVLSLEEFRQEFELPFPRFYDRFVPDIPVPQLELWFHEAFNKELESVSPMAHARDFLEFCDKNQIRSFVLSAIHQQHFKVHIEKSGFGRYFEKVYTGVLDKREKIHEILSDHKLVQEETLYIGDMEHDIETAHHGGVAGCAVLTGFKELKALQKSQPDLIVEHLGELKGILEKTALEPFHNGQSPTSITNSPFPIPTVGALIFNSSNEVLMIRTHKWSDKWGIPGGKIQNGESSVEALRREIREETSLEIDEIQFVMVQDAISPKEFYRDAHFLLLNYTCRCHEEVLNVVLNDEAQDYCWVPLQDALQLNLNEPTQILIHAVLNENVSKPLKHE